MLVESAVIPMAAAAAGGGGGMSIGTMAGLAGLFSSGMGMVGGLTGKGSSDSASDAAMFAAELAWRQYSGTRADEMPWITAGQGAIKELSTLTQPGEKLYDTEFSTEDFKADPSYEWRKQEGINALAAAGAASGNYGSGNMGVALQNYGQNLASTEYQSAYDRWMTSMNTLYSRLSGISNTGQNAATQTGNIGMQAAQIGMQGAGIEANAKMAGENALASGYQNIANQGMSGFGTMLKYDQNQQLIEALKNRSNPWDWNTGGAVIGSPGFSGGYNSWDPVEYNKLIGGF